MLNILLVSATETEHQEKELFGHPIHIIGIGKINAAINTTKLIRQYNPHVVVNFGSCGNLKNFEIGKVLEVREVVNDMDTQGLTKELPLRLTSLQGVTCFTTDTIYDNSHQRYSDLYNTNIQSCDIVDMELYSIAKSCKDENISLYSYKWVSDDGSPSSWAETAAIGYNNFKEVFKEKFL